MSKSVAPFAWLMGGIGMAGMWWASKHIAEKDRKAFVKLVREQGLTNPADIWDAAKKHHDKLRKELTEAKARIKDGEELCRIAHGLAKVRDMMEAGSHWPSDIEFKHFLNIEISEEETQAALQEMQKQVVPAEVKMAVIAHWWTQLWQLFVPWGIVLPEEIEEVKGPFFRLVGPEVREAVLRAEVFKYKESSKGWKEAYDKACEREKEAFKRHCDRQQAWQEEKKRLLEEIEQLKANQASSPE